MKILHAADLHLGSPMETHLSAKKAKQRRAEQKNAFADLLRTAKTERVSAVLLCGDIAETADLHGETAAYVLEMLSDLAPIPVYMIRGNHDPLLFSGVVLPDNVTLFSDGWQSVMLNDGEVSIAISARELPLGSLTIDAFMKGYPTVKDADIHIAMLHGQLTDALTFGGDGFLLPRKAFAGKNIDYLALGHIHARSSEHIDRTCLASYSGCLMGRGFDECGEKGFIMLDIHKSAGGKAELSTEFYKTNARIYHHVCIDVTDLPLDAMALSGAVEAATADMDERDIVRIELIGEESPEAMRDLAMIAARLEERFYAAELRDRRGVKIDIDALARDVSLKGVFIKNVLSSELSEEDKAAVIRMGIGALRGS